MIYGHYSESKLGFLFTIFEGVVVGSFDLSEYKWLTVCLDKVKDNSFQNEFAKIKYEFPCKLKH